MRLLTKCRKGMTLVEIMIVVVVLGVILGAVLLLLTKGTTEFHFSRRQNELDIAGRQALDAMTSSIIWAGYMPHGGWEDADWHPVVTAQESIFVFYADWSPFEILEPTDYRTILLNSDGRIEISDGNGLVLNESGHNITDLRFNYLDEGGNNLGSNLDSLAQRDMVRHIQIEIELTEEYANQVYQTVMKTTVSPRNLGINHDINPGFYPPNDPEGRIVFNVDSDTSGLSPMPNADQQAMINRLSFWGYTLTILTDSLIPYYDYTDINLLVLRNMQSGSHTFKAFTDSLGVPIITMTALDAVQLFGMGTTSGSLSEDTMKAEDVNHPVNRYLDTEFVMYTEDAENSVLSDFATAPDSTAFLTGAGLSSTYSGVSVIRDHNEAMRRIHYSPWQATKYTAGDGWRFFRNVIEWATYIPGAYHHPLSTLEDFEGAQPSETLISIWYDPINPVIIKDTIPIYTEDFEAFPVGPADWILVEGGTAGRCGAISESGQKFLRMDRFPAGTNLRNFALWTTDLSAYNENLDDLVFRVDTYKGTFEGNPGVNDGIFFLDADFSMDTVATIDFENRANQDLEFWGDLYGRYRIHEPAGWSGDGRFATLDSRVSGQNARNRMMIEVSTTGHVTGEDINITYRFHDHNDVSSSEDFLGWNSTGDITGAYSLVELLDPSSYPNNTWTDRTVSFTPGTMPDPIYIVFGQQGNQSADDFTSSGGISLDNIIVSIGHNDSIFTKIGDPSLDPGWNRVAIDLDDAAVSSGVHFTSNFGVVLSQEGSGTWNSFGRSWDNSEICVLKDQLSAAGWSHGELNSAAQGYIGIDDWSIEDLGSGDYCWGLRENDSTSYSAHSYCYLQSPDVAIPDNATNVEFSFRHSFNTADNNAGGYVTISVDGGLWNTLPYTYTGTCGLEHPAAPGPEIFFGSSGGWKTEYIDLSAYAGHHVQFRFIFGANNSLSGGNWQLDDFEITANVSGWEINSVDFLATTHVGINTNTWTYNDVDIYMSYCPDTVFTSGGAWNTGNMQLVAQDLSPMVTWSVTDSLWHSFDLDTVFFLPEDQSLMIKVLKYDPVGSLDTYNWGCILTPGNTARNASGSVPPTSLGMDMYLPVIRLNTTSGVLNSPDPGFDMSYVPLDSRYMYSDFEGIYSPSILGSSSLTNWTHGGVGDDWEFDAPVFVPDVDPFLMIENDNNIAGTDLTVDGYYGDDFRYWLVSESYEMPDSIPTSVVLRYFRCIRLAPLDLGFVYVAFTDTPTAPDSSSADWILVRTYSGENQDFWNYEDVYVTSEFIEAAAANKNYFFVRYILDSNGSNALGGWNLDNVQFLGSD